MKIRYLIILLILISKISFSQVPSGNWSVTPDPFLENQEITITVSDINSGNLSGINDIYLWTWYTKNGGGSTNDDSQWNGQWNNSNENMKMIKNTDGSFSFTFNPSKLYSDSSIEKIGVLAFKIVFTEKIARRKRKKLGTSFENTVFTGEIRIIWCVRRLLLTASRHKAPPPLHNTQTNTHTHIETRLTHKLGAGFPNDFSITVAEN